MSTAQRRGLRPGGVVRALGRLVLLIGFGFGAGLLIGVLSEEPELLAGHLRGEGEAIVLTPAADDGTPAEQAPSEQGSERLAIEREAAMKPRPEDDSDRRLPGVAAAPALLVTESQNDHTWAIQVGAFSDEAAATRLAEGLGAKGYPTELLAAGGDSQRWRVRVQPVRGGSGWRG